MTPRNRRQPHKIHTNHTRIHFPPAGGDKTITRQIAHPMQLTPGTISEDIGGRTCVGASGKMNLPFSPINLMPSLSCSFNARLNRVYHVMAAFVASAVDADA